MNSFIFPVEITRTSNLKLNSYALKNIFINITIWKFWQFFACQSCKRTNLNSKCSQQKIALIIKFLISQNIYIIKKYLPI